ncbi:hypothetical protein U1Q18_025491, partial [Sarracenia purpurea var. burkii]
FSRVFSGGTCSRIGACSAHKKKGQQGQANKARAEPVCQDPYARRIPTLRWFRTASPPSGAFPRSVGARSGIILSRSGPGTRRESCGIDLRRAWGWRKVARVGNTDAIVLLS